MNTVQFKAAFQRMWEEAQQEVLFQSMDISRLLEVHPSQIPICPTSFVLSFVPSTKLERSRKMISDAILNTGTTIHRVVQDYLSKSPNAFGNFVCHECGEVFPLTTSKEVCPNGCGAPLFYEEVPISYKGFAGHVDFMVKIKDEIWLVDFKTSSGFSIDKKVKNTPSNYDLQTLAYVLLLRLQYKIKVKGRAIAYISRDNPAVMKIGGCKRITTKDLKYIHRLLLEQRDLLNFLLDCHSYEEFMDNVGIQRCSNPYCSVCGKAYSDEDLQKLLQQKFDTFNGKCIRDFVKEAQAEQEKTNKVTDTFIDMCKGDRK